MGFISDILEHEAIVSLLLAGTALGTVGRLECESPFTVKVHARAGLKWARGRVAGWTYESCLNEEVLTGRG